MKAFDIYHQKRDKELLVLGVVASESDSSDNEDYDSDESEDSVDERLGKKKINGDIYVDIYHQKRDKEILGDFTTEKKKHRVESEVLGVVASESDSSDNEDYDSDESEDSVDERLGKKKINGDIS
uniref:Uncharacterized protein n=1 Tax=Panagrolaimus sp. ES5 TaxID=591445 RepID=A0AC34G3Y7_9BILA